MFSFVFFGLLGAFPCDGVRLDYERWPVAVSVADMMMCLQDVEAGNCPVADAGREQFAQTGMMIQLDGSASTAPSGSMLQWVQVANGAPGVMLQNASSATPNFTPTLPGSYVFELQMTQGCLTDVDQVHIEVTDQIAAPQTLSFSSLVEPNDFPAGVSATPAQVQQAPGQPERLYILTLQGRIWIRENGAVLNDPYIDVSSLLGNCFECNLTSMAFHPDFEENGIVLIKYVGTLLNGSGSNTDVRVAGFAPGNNPDVLSLNDGVDLVTISKPTDIHPGGSILFGKDGLLYMGNGDSGPQGDPNGHAQNTNLLNGKILRYQINGLNPVTIPASNPFVDDPNVSDEIYAIGIRNPWRITRDRQTGDFFIGDNGQDDVEEISFLSGEGVGGQNLGWNIMEGNQCFNPPMGCDPNGLTMPIFDYDHSPGCSVIGGYVYRGSAVPAANGFYLYGDWCTGQLSLLRLEEGQWVNRQVNVTGAPGLGGNNLVGFGEDLQGELYVCAGGRVYQLTGAAL